MFISQGQAKRFFVDKIAAQAMREGHPLSEDQRWMLSFSESDPEFLVDPSRVTAVEAEIADHEYEEKVAGLAQRACATDLEFGAATWATYKEAFRVLNQGDHYVLIMLAQGLSRWIRPWCAFWR